MARMSLTTFKSRLASVNTTIAEYFHDAILIPTDYYSCPRCTGSTQTKNIVITMIRLEAPFTVAVLMCPVCRGLGFVNLMEKTLYNTSKQYDLELVHIFSFSNTFEQSNYIRLAAYALNAIYPKVKLWDYLDPDNNTTKALFLHKT